MKLGVTLSTSIHTVLLGWALLSFSAPAPLITMEDAGVEVDFAALSPDASSANGEKKADVEAKPKPVPTKKPEVLPDAKNAGDAKEDGPKSRKGEITDKPLDTEKTQAAPEAEKVVKAPKTEPEPVKEPEKETTPVKTSELAALNEPKVDITEEKPKEEAKLEPLDPSQPKEKPEVTPVPAKAPADRPKPRTPETNDRKKAEEQKQEKTATSTEKTKEVTDKIGDLLNKQANTESGAKRVASNSPSVGDPAAKPGAELTRGEYDGLKGRVGQCWSIPTYVDQENLKIDMTMRMSKDGFLEEVVSIDVSGVDNPAHAKAVKSSLARNLDRANCDFSDVLPADKYETWKDVRVRFSASEIQ
jgi:hypothetical protein